MARSRAFARCMTFLLVAAMLGCEGCKTPGSRGKDLREAYETTALAWVEALGAGDGAGSALEALTDGTLFFRTVGEDKQCDGRVSGGDAAFAAWLACVRDDGGPLGTRRRGRRAARPRRARRRQPNCRLRPTFTTVSGSSVIVTLGRTDASVGHRLH